MKLIQIVLRLRLFLGVVVCIDLDREIVCLTKKKNLLVEVVEIEVV